jgi:hypothetical protein
MDIRTGPAAAPSAFPTLSQIAALAAHGGRKGRPPASSKPGPFPRVRTQPGPYIHILKTTLNIDDTVMAERKREAARQGRTISELVETALRLLLSSQRKRGKIPALPKFRSGGALVDVADRDALYQAMEGR